MFIRFSKKGMLPDVKNIQEFKSTGDASSLSHSLTHFFRSRTPFSHNLLCETIFHIGIQNPNLNIMPPPPRSADRVALTI